MFAIIRRAFQYLDEINFPSLYKALVRSHLDFASPIWSPLSTKLIEQIEGVQRRSTKQLPGMKNLSYPERLKKLKLPTLSYRRARGDMIEMYKIMTGVYDRETGGFIKRLNDVVPRTGKRGHPLKIYHQHSKTSLRRNSFSLRVANIWNGLPTSVVTADSINTFKNRLDRYWADQEILYDDFKAKIKVTGRGAEKRPNKSPMKRSPKGTCIGNQL